MNNAFTKGKFKKLGLSNFTVAEVEEVMDICEERGWVKPSVYKGQYNPIVRGGEEELFPVPRKHDIAFYAWRYGCPHSSCLAFWLALTHWNSPAAAGLFAENHKLIKIGDRFDSTVSCMQEFNIEKLLMETRAGA